MARITEAEIAKVVEQILRDRPNGRAMIADLIDEIPNRVTLSREDLAKSPTRANERVWEQQVRNITSHKDSPGNAIYEGKLVATPGVVPRHSDFKNLNCQTALSAHTGAKGFFLRCKSNSSLHQERSITPASPAVKGGGAP